MASERAFGGISRTVFDAIQVASRRDHGTAYVPPGSDTGQAITDTPVGQVVLDFAFDETAQTVSYTIAKKPFVVTEGEVWSGIQSTIDACKA